MKPKPCRKSESAIFEKQFTITAYDPEADLVVGATESVFVQRLNYDFTVNEVFCESNVASTTIRLLRDDGSPNSITSAVITSSTTPNLVSEKATLSVGQSLDFEIVSAPAGLQRLNVTVNGK